MLMPRPWGWRWPDSVLQGFTALVPVPCAREVHLLRVQAYPGEDIWVYRVNAPQHEVPADAFASVEHPCERSAALVQRRLPSTVESALNSGWFSWDDDTRSICSALATSTLGVLWDPTEDGHIAGVASATMFAGALLHPRRSPAGLWRAQPTLPNHPGLRLQSFRFPRSRRSDVPVEWRNAFADAASVHGNEQITPVGVEFWQRLGYSPSDANVMWSALKRAPHERTPTALWF